MTARAAEPMPAGQADAFRAAHAEYRDAIDPHSPWANARLSVAVTAALNAGWSARAIGEGLGIERKRVPVIAAHAPAEQLVVPGPARDAPLPDAVVRVFRRCEDTVNRRRLTAERRWVATVRAARAAGWSCGSLGTLVGVSGERIRSVAGMELDVSDVKVPAFERPARTGPSRPAPAEPGLTGGERDRMRQLAAGQARKSRRTRATAGDASRKAPLLEARRASEELTDLIVAAAGRGVTWAEIDRACGYARGAARARAVRHGHGPAWASVTPYRKTGDDIFSAAGITPPARKEA